MNLDSELLNFRQNIIEQYGYNSIDNIMSSLEEEFLFFLELKIGEDALKKYVDNHILPPQIFHTAILLILEKRVMAEPNNESLQHIWIEDRNNLENAWRENHPEVFNPPYFRDNMTNDEIALECVKRVCYPIIKSVFEVRK